MKILNIVYVHRKETKNKWWHRLVSVLIYGSAILLLVFILIPKIIINKDLYTNKYIIYNFENGYKEKKGKEIGCEFKLIKLGIYEYDSLSTFSSKCVPYPHSYSNFLNRYLSSKNKSSINITDPKEYIVELVRQNRLIDVKSKEVTDFYYGDFFILIFIYLIILFLWLVFWWSVIYRTILYIVYGKEKK